MADSAAAARLELFIASGCNLHCYFCCESDRIAQRRFMPWGEIDAHLVQAAARGVQVLQFMGGEATLHPEFPRALQRARALGMRTFVITNLLRWEDRAFAEAVAPFLDEVMISQHAHGDADGARVTGRPAWWARFSAAAANARDTLRARVRASTVLDAANTPDLERIADSLLAFRPEVWVLGSGVPIVGARAPVVAQGNSLTALRALRPRLQALRDRCADQGCRLVFFCIPQCVLGPDLWDHAHDLSLLDQDLSENAPSDAASVNFWARPEYRDRFRPVTLARRRGAPCATCTRRDRCGGHFAEYLDAHGEHELEPIL
jgi:MoaA/NifB/PqqE/SkfB family radical SAM enzyme